MMRCEICGVETRKNRQVCKGCCAVKKVAKSREYAPEEIKKVAYNHLKKNPGLTIISFKSFFKKNKRVTI